MSEEEYKQEVADIDEQILLELKNIYQANEAIARLTERRVEWLRLFLSK